MTRDEYKELMRWMAPRWTEYAAWVGPEHTAMLTDLRPYTLPQVLIAVDRLWTGGRERAPRGGVVLSMLKELGMHPEQAEVKALPEPVRDYTGSVPDWLRDLADRKNLDTLGDDDG